jgi:hypothetical protein
MQVYQTDSEGFFVGVVNADPDPLDVGKFLIPAGCVEQTPPALAGNEQARWGGVSWAVVVITPEPEPEEEPEPTPEEALAQERSIMRCRAAAMRLVLHRQGLLATVQAIADSDPEASIVFEYETEYSRNDPFITSLGGPNGFTPEQIDDLFRAAMVL